MGITLPGSRESQIRVRQCSSVHLGSLSRIVVCRAQDAADFNVLCTREYDKKGTSRYAAVQHYSVHCAPLNIVSALTNTTRFLCTAASNKLYKRLPVVRAIAYA